MSLCNVDLTNITQTYACGLDSYRTFSSEAVSSIQACCESERVNVTSCSSGQTAWCEVAQFSNDDETGPNQEISKCLRTLRADVNVGDQLSGSSWWCSVRTYSCEGEHYKDFGCPGWDPNAPSTSLPAAAATTTSATSGSSSYAPTAQTLDSGSRRPSTTQLGASSATSASVTAAITSSGGALASGVQFDCALGMLIWVVLRRVTIHLL